MGHTVTITQRGAMADGSDRSFTLHARPADLPERLRRIAYAYNLERTTVRVDGRFVTLHR